VSAPARRLSADELRELFLFADLGAEQLDWVAGHGDVVDVPVGTELTLEGAPAECFYVLLDGALSMVRQVAGAEVELARSEQRGVYCGAVTFYFGDRIEQRYPSTVRALADSTFLALPAGEFAEVFRRWFPMPVHLLEGMVLAQRSTGDLIGRREQLVALGSMSAGLTHELNNPAAAASRAAAALRERFAGMRHKLALLADGRVDGAMLAALTGVQDRLVARIAQRPDLTAIERSDREDELGDWLEDHEVTEPWALAGVFVGAGIDDGDLDGVVDAVSPAFLEPALRWLAYTVEAETLLLEITESTSRISNLVEAARQYSQLDRMPHQPTDLHAGLDATLVMMAAKTPDGVTVVKEYDRTLPLVPAYAGELNQVWTNLVHNALDAMEDGGTLTVRTAREGECALVEIVDTGPGIPEGLRRRVFEPFFTTKPVGQGTGLGLDVSYRIVVNRHRGDLRVQSVPGDTRFQVLLPLADTPEFVGEPVTDDAP
jgi:signal transduction histidine kinase